ncbi:Retrovirus-related Pol polyprotein from transposon 17.6 [Dictyocoela muelleri]|nr:Retrovirus-related Pol polyprotein from transposon 17.6 [Dictyocoela muelleri]
MNSPFISPAFFIRKSNGKLRLIVDYRHLIEVTVKAHNLRPKIMEILYKFKGCKFFTKLDLDQGFYQIRIKQEDVPKTGFRVMGETYVFKRMPFGLTNAPFTFQIAINKAIEGLSNTYCYIDDILIASPDFKSHMDDVERVLSYLSKQNFSVNYDKCQFAQPQVQFLGYILNSDGIRMETSKIEDFKHKTPKTKKQLERLIGFLNWFRNCIPNLSLHLASFYEKLKIPGKSIKWEKMNEENLSKLMSIIKEQKNDPLS